MMQRFLVSMASLGLMLSLTYGAVAKTSAAADSKAANSVSHGDQSWVIDAYKGGAEEVRLGELAASKGSAASVKAFGQAMVTDHSAANKQLKELADKKGIKLATTDSASDKDYKKLDGMSGAAFDKAYIDMMVKDHTKDVADFKKESTKGNDPNIKGWAGKTLPTLEHHLKMAQDAQATVGK